MPDNDSIVAFEIFFERTDLLINFGIILLGLIFGKLQIKGVGFATSGVLIIAMAGGYLFQFEPIMILQDLGIVLFLLCIGLEAGPSFFRAFQKHGKIFITNVFVLLIAAGIVVVLIIWISGIPAGIGLGLFAGSFTSSPALISAMQFSPEREVIFGYGIAYPFGLIGVILFINIAMKVLRRRMESEVAGNSKMFSAVFRLEAKTLAGNMIRDIDLFHDHEVVVTGIMRDSSLIPASGKTVLVKGDILRLEGAKEGVEEAGKVIGSAVEQDFTNEGEFTTRSIVVENMNVINRSLMDLGIRLRFNTNITRVIRSDFEMYPRHDLILSHGDVVEAVGTPYQLDQLEMFLGHSQHTVQRRVDIASLSATLFLAFFLGGIIIPIPQLGPFSLGLAGGALIAGLIFGHFGRIGNFIGRFPKDATVILKELGLAMFFVQVGFDTGQSFIDNLGPHVIYYAIFAALFAVLPMAASFFVGHYFLKISVSECFGVICGGMTFTPGLDVIRQVDESEKPVIAYSSVYPVSLIMVILLVQLMYLSLSLLGAV